MHRFAQNISLIQAVKAVRVSRFVPSRCPSPSTELDLEPLAAIHPLHLLFPRCRATAQTMNLPVNPTQKARY